MPNILVIQGAQALLNYLQATKDLHQPIGLLDFQDLIGMTEVILQNTKFLCQED